MRVDNCVSCSKRFEVVEIGGDQPHKPEIDHIKCPYCGYVTWAKTTGYFSVKKLRQVKQSPEIEMEKR